MLIDPQRARTAALWLSAGGGGVLGFFVGRGTVTSSSDAVVALAHTLAAQSASQAAIPIIATSITAASAIIGSTLCCCSVWYVIHRTDMQENDPHA